MGTLRHFTLLMWKNCLLRKRHYVMTICELILPTLLSVLLMYTNMSFSGPFQVVQYDATVYRPYTERAIMGYMSDRLQINTRTVLGYTPANMFTESLMGKIQEFVNVEDTEIVAYDTEDDILEAADNFSSMAFTNNKRQFFVGGVVFEGEFPEDGSPPKNLRYKVRLHPPFHTKYLYDTRFGVSPLDEYFASNYINRKFTAIQLAIDKGFTALVCKNCTADNLPEINAQLMAYPAYKEYKAIQLIFDTLLPLFLVLSFIFLCPTIIKGVVNEKDTGVKELMKMMGLSELMSWVGWMVNAMMVLLLSIIIIVVVLTTNFSGGPDGGVLKHTDPTIFLLFLILYGFASVAFCFAVSSFIHKPTLATTIGVILWLASFFGPMIPMLEKYNDLNFSDKILACFLPNMAMTFGIKVISLYESRGFHMRWSNIHHPGISTDNISMLDIYIMLIVDTFLYLAVTWYISSVMPGKYGIAKPWYFIFQRSYWFPRTMTRIKSEQSSGSISARDSSHSSFEREPRELPLGIAVQDLYKEFRALSGGVKIAVDRINLNIYEGQITALLGHNGAGKTTLMSILTGLFSPTSGTALINGYDITKNMNKVQESLSLCPQHNMLFSMLTVEEHLELFGMLKGISKAEARKKGQELLEQLNLSNKSKSLASSLSGGQKRKLSLSIALIGNSKVVMLDEPTTGMDPEARRGVWDLLLSLRGKLTIIITTHFMEEADILGDRIAIMAHGKVQCCGSTIFLKKIYGTGYHLKMSILPECDVNKVTEIVQSHITNAWPKKRLRTEVSYLLPADLTSEFPNLFKALDEAKSELGIAAFGVSLTTMEEVFMRVGEIADKEKYGSQEETEIPVTPAEPEQIMAFTTKDRAGGYRLMIQQTSAIFKKCVLHSRRSRILILFQAMFPILLAFLCLYLSRKQTPDNVPNDPARLLSLGEYRTTNTLVQWEENDAQRYADQYIKLVSDYSWTKVQRDKDITKYLLALGAKDLALYREHNVVAATFNVSDEGRVVITALYSTVALHSAGISINLADNSVLHALAGPDYSITTINHPLKDTEKFKAQMNASSVVYVNGSLMFAIFLFIGLSMLAASFVVLPVQERICQAKQLQLMTGIHPRLYWLASLSWDLLLYFITIIIMIIVISAMDSHHIYTVNHGIGVIFLIAASFGWAGITFSYLMSFGSSTVPGAFAFLALVHIVTGLIGSIIVWSLQLSEVKDLIRVGHIVESIFQFFPSFPLCFGLLQFSFLASNNNRCNFISAKALQLICRAPLYFDDKITACCEDFCKVKDNCIKPADYLTWKVETQPLEATQSDFGVGQAIFFLILDGFIYFELIMLIEMGIFAKIWSKINRRRITPHDIDLDEDVLKEQERVTHQDTLSLDAKTLVVDKLSKMFGSFPAVRGISFGAIESECFGLLGVNGAGKTTTFRMLTGDEVPSTGTAYIFGNKVTQNRRMYLASIGYCPQFDGIVGVLTGQEMLEMFARLRGIQRYDTKAEVHKWVRRLGLEDHIRRACGTYSGGNKRKLSTAMALIGDPPVIFLDEPTSGVDPVARRNLWQVLGQIRTTGQAIVLTSHSMEECEALCSRVAIMVNGQFKCLGGPQHLKSKFGQGYTVMLKMKQGETTTVGKSISSLKRMMESAFDPCDLQDEHQGVLQYQVTNSEMSWPYLFQTMEAIKKEVDLLEDYSISETTLEQVFLFFAKKQEEENPTTGLFSAFKHCCSSSLTKVKIV